MTGEGGLLHDVGVVLLGRAKPMQEHNRRQDTVAVKGGDVQPDALHRQRDVRLSEGLGFGHVMDSLSEKGDRAANAVHCGERACSRRAA